MKILSTFIRDSKYFDNILSQSYSIDKYDFHKISNANRFVIPRPGLLYSLKGRIPLIGIISLVYVGQFLLPLFLFLVIMKASLSKRRLSLNGFNSIFLMTDSISFQKVKNLKEISFDGILSFQNPLKLVLSQKISDNSYYLLFSLKELFAIYTKTIIHSLYFWIKNIFSFKSLQVFFAMDTFFLDEFRAKLDCSELQEIIFTDHYCKYALSFSHVKSLRKIQIQHGIFDPKFQPASPIDVDKCYVFNSADKQVIQNNIHRNSRVKYCYFRQTLTFEKIGRSNSFKVFFISRLDSFEMEKKLITSIRKNYDSDAVELIIKPHPKMSKSRYSDKFYTYMDIIVVEKVFCYPNADIVIGSNSTMLFEYEACGFKTFRFDDPNILDYLKISISKNLD